MWKFIWNSLAPPKVKTFLWKSCLGAIGVLTNLKQRGVMVSDVCVGCRLDAKSAEHALVYCPLARQAWFASVVALRVNARPNLSILEWILEWSKSLGASKMERKVCFTSHAMVAWEIWKLRNARCFKSSVLAFSSWISMVNKEVEEVLSIALCSPPLAASASRLVTPSHPLVGCYSFFVDAATGLRPKALGIGCVAFDPGGEICLFASEHFALAPTIVGEALAIRLALSSTRKMGIRSILVSSDYLSLIECLSPSPPPSPPSFSCIIPDICILKASFTFCDFVHVNRSGNGLAHAILKWVLSCPSGCFWEPPFPREVLNIVNPFLSRFDE
ncbi:uncharacterized protein LOC122643362 [Telopea speciosissima]|uniref:uncharacterized protein LOC122643362 n=1 Tax=Telopea speciosissima TaxID=54955 RepID=UPI001CC4AE96|nr:uncharacterized protein LOC122643362 [Telopea speciosissima]